MHDTSSGPFRLSQIALPAFGPPMLFGVSEGAVLPILALTARDLGTSPMLAGLIVSLVGIGSLLANIPAASLTARFGERVVMVGASLFTLLALIICLAANTAWLFAIGVFMIGMASSVFKLARQTFLIQAVPLAMRARAMSTLGGAMRVGQFTGPLLAAGFIHFMGMAGAYWMAIVAIAGTGLLSLAIPDLETREQRIREQAHAIGFGALLRQHAHVYFTLGLGTALISALRASRQIAIPLWGDHIGMAASAVALIYGLMGIIDMLLFYPAGRVMDTRGRRWVAIPCAFILGSTMIAIPFTHGFTGLLVVSLVLGFGNGIGSGIISTIGADASPARGRTKFLGIWRILSDSGMSGGPVVMSMLIGAVSLGAGISAIGALGYVAVGLFWRWLPRRTMGM